MKRYFFGRYSNAARRLWRDEDGIVLPYVTIMLIAIIGLSGLALDASRMRSLKTQMQAGADALALAGARELDGSDGSITRATSAINTMISNTPQGMGAQSTISAATITFYSSLYAATDARIGAVTTNANAAKYVGVTVSPASVDPILPIPIATPSINAMAVAGYDFALCNMPPVFICNPYEQPGDTNETANNRWRTLVNLTDNKQKLMKLTVNGGSGYGPGHFGFLMPPDDCNGADCLRDWIATRSPKACYRKKNVDLNTGQMQSVFDAFNVRFDIYDHGVKATADFGPASNVRKGYTSTGNACNATAAANATLVVPAVTATGTTTKNKTTVTAVTTQGQLLAGQLISGTGIAAGTTVASFTSNTIELSQKASADGSGVSLTIGGAQTQQVAGYPRDVNMIYDPSAPGDGQWDCADYWKIVHGGSPPSGIGCGHGTVADPTSLSRAQLYDYENTTAAAGGPGPDLLNDLSGPLAPNDAKGETGAPMCNAANVVPYDRDDNRRTVYAAIINCVANSALITGGQTADDIPVAGFGKFFMTEPADTGSQTLYGEMNGAVGLDKNAKNNVQLYR